MADEIKESALRYIFGLRVSVLPLVRNHKKPCVDTWKDYQSRFASGAEVMAWPTGNLGIVTGSVSGIVVVDCESVEDATWFWKQRGQTTAIAETPRGIHFYFQHPGEPVFNSTKVKDENGRSRYDIRGDGGYVVAPPSHVEEQDGVSRTGDYKWRPGKELISTESLPLFKPEWRPATQTLAGRTKKITDGVAYIAKIRAVSGQGGHNETYKAACCLRDAEMSEVDALAAIIDWNTTNAEPPWSTADLLHKIRDAYSKE